MKPIIGSKADHREDWVRFRRHHTGDLQRTGPALQSLWPILAAGLAFIACGGVLINRGAHAGVALGGLCLGGIGLAFVATFFWLMGREIDG